MSRIYKLIQQLDHLNENVNTNNFEQDTDRSFIDHLVQAISAHKKQDERLVKFHLKQAQPLVSTSQHGKALDAYRKLDQAYNQLSESAEELEIGDDVVITGNVEFKGATGIINNFSRDKRFVAVNLYQQGKHSFHSSDVSANDGGEDGEYYYNRDPGESYYSEDVAATPVKKTTRRLGGFPVKVINIENQGVDEAVKLNAPQRRISRDELQGYSDRIKTGTKNKRDKFSPIIHGSNIKAITKDDGGAEWDLDDLAQQITQRPRAILGTNAKMTKSKTEGEIVYDLTLPALSGIVVDEETGDFVEITTCPGAGGCQLFCYARKGGYVMFPASSMSAAQALNFLVNDPDGYTATVNKEIHTIKNKTDKAGIQLVVRWHDAGDFFSKEYLDLAYGVAESNPDVQFYAYTKMGDVATGSSPANFTMNFSSGSKRSEEKKVEFYKAAGNVVKNGVTVPKDMFFDLIARKGTSLIKDAKGRTQFKDSASQEEFKQRLAQKYRVTPDSIITYDQMLSMPVGPEPKWNVIVQPGAGDRAANRKDVIDSYLMFH
jgi:hypothetical protein